MQLRLNEYIALMGQMALVLLSLPILVILLNIRKNRDINGRIVIIYLQVRNIRVSKTNMFITYIYPMVDYDFIWSI